MQLCIYIKLCFWIQNVDTVNSPVSLWISWLCYVLSVSSCIIEECILKDGCWPVHAPFAVLMHLKGPFAGMMADLERELKFEHQQPVQQLQQEPSPSAVMPSSGTSFTFSRASSIGSVNAISCSSASSTHNTGRPNACTSSWRDNFVSEVGGCVTAAKSFMRLSC